MASYEAKIGLKRMRMRKNENYRSVSFLLDALYKNSKKNSKKLKKYHYGIISNRNRLEVDEKQRK